MLKNTAQLVHSRHRSINNFLMNMVSALGAYCFFENKPKAIQGYQIERTKQIEHGNIIPNLRIPEILIFSDLNEVPSKITPYAKKYW
jgi:hypothetical protein